MNETIIITGGNIKEEFLKKVFLENKYENIIASDKGLEALDKLGLKPNYIIGDFDSINEEILSKYLLDKEIKTIKLNPEKDYTDTHMALKLAIELKSTNIIIVGAIGSRIDHTIANIHILKEALDKNIKCSIINENNKIQLINKDTTIERNENFRYISLIPLTTKVCGITLKGFKYGLINATLEIGKSLGVSNEQTKELAIIEIKEGILLLIQSRD